MFSHQPANTSQNTSLNTTKIIVETFVTQDISIEQKETLIQNTDHMVRKLAHFTLYTIGGFLIYNVMNTYNIYFKKKVIYSIAIGVIYACSDELHQLFVEGRGGMITDVFIDSLGIITGIGVFLCMLIVIQMIRKRNIKEVKL